MKIILTLCLVTFLSNPKTVIFQADYHVKYDTTVGIKKVDLEELNEYITANDKEGFVLAVTQKTRNGSAFRISKGTMVRVLDSEFFYAKIRVVDGNNKNKIGSIDREAIK